MWEIFKRNKDKKKGKQNEDQPIDQPEIGQEASDAEPSDAPAAAGAVFFAADEPGADEPGAPETAVESGVENGLDEAATFDEPEPVNDDADAAPHAVSDPAGDAPADAPDPEEARAPKAKKKGLFGKLMDGLKKTRDTLFGGLFVESDEKIDDDFYDELEEAMIISDMGMNTTEKLLAELRSRLKADGIHKRSEARTAMADILAGSMQTDTEFRPDTEPAVILIVGVNGVGKTTSIGKLAHMYKEDGRSVMLAAGDTFRAAAAEQLTIWAERADVPIIKHNEGADPAAVVFDAIASYKAKKCDLLICDTAGRLHNKKNLMNELAKIRRVIDRELPGVCVEVLLVLDATTGQNAIAQAKAFGENTGLTGIILTKLDGTAKGGVVVAVKDELGLPVRFVGVGEGIDDLQPFDARSFAEALI